MGLSLQHTSEVPQLLNLSTGSITNQFHVVFDDQFTTVSSVERETEPPDHWEELCLENSSHILTDTESSNPLNDWLSPEEQEEKRRDIQRDTTIRDSQMRRLNTKPHPSQTREQRERPRSVTPTPESPYHNVDERSTTSVATNRVFSQSRWKPPGQKRSQILQLQALPGCEDLLAPPQDITKQNAMQMTSLPSLSLFATTQNTRQHWRC
jgi:hypothetical protein